MRTPAPTSTFFTKLFYQLLTVTFTASILSSAPVFAKTNPTPPLPASGDVLIAGGVSSGGNVTKSAEFYSVSSKKFVVTGAMSEARATLQSEVMSDTPESEANNDVGKIYMIGGFRGSAKPARSSITFNIILTLDDFEVYDPPTGTFAVPTLPTLQPMTNPRAFFPVINVPNDAPHIMGHFVVIAGLCNAPDLDSCRTSDVIHPDDHVTTTSNPLVGRAMHTATVMQDKSSILITGGFADLMGAALNTAEILDTNTDDFSPIANMNASRAGQTATLLQDGTVLIAGGFNSSGSAQNTAEIFNLGKGTFTSVASMHDSRAWHTATPLSDGTVLLAGGFNGSAAISLTGAATGVTGTWTASSGAVLRTAEIYDPITKTFTCVHGAIRRTGGCQMAMKAARMDQTATALADGDVLIAGGFGAMKAMLPLRSAELFHAGKFVNTGRMTAARAWHTAIALP